MTTILDYWLIKDILLPFVLVFVLVFAILQKSKILGEGKTQIDALVSLVIGLILVATPPARDFIVRLMPWLAVGLAVILVFLVLFSFVGNGSWNAKWLKIVVGILSGIFLIVVVLWASGESGAIGDFFSNNVSGGIISNIILIAIILGAVLIVALTSKPSKS
jgi:hypothetical protein